MIQTAYLDELMKGYIKNPQVEAAIEKLISEMDKHFKNRSLTRDCQKDPIKAVEALDECLNMIDGADKTLSIMRELSSKVNHLLQSKKTELRSEQVTIRNTLTTEEQLNIMKKYSTKAEKEEYKKTYLDLKTYQLEEEIKSISLDRDMAANYVKDAENQRDKVYAYYQSIKKVVDSNKYN